MDSSVFEDLAASSDAFSPEPKPVCPSSRLQSSIAFNDYLKIKAKAPAKKPVASTTSKASTAPKKLTQTTLKKAPAKKRRKADSDEENSDPAASDNDSLASDKAPVAKKQKKAPAPKKPAGKPLEPLDDSQVNMDGAYDEAVQPKPKKGSATEQYQKVCRVHSRILDKTAD